MITSYTSDDVDRAEEHYRASLRAHRRLGNAEGINGALINLGACRYDAHDFAGAERLWREAARGAAELGYEQREAVLHNNLGSLFEARGELDEAGASFGQSLALRRKIGDVSGVANVLHNLGRLCGTRGELSEAREHLETALQIYLEIDDRAGVAHTRSRLARVLAASGLDHLAREQARRALETALEIDSRVDILGSLLTVANLREKDGRLGDARSLALTVAGAATGSHEPLRAEAEELVARVSDRLGTTAPVSSTQLTEVARRELAVLANGTH